MLTLHDVATMSQSGDLTAQYERPRNEVGALAAIAVQTGNAVNRVCVESAFVAPNQNICNRAKAEILHNNNTGEAQIGAKRAGSPKLEQGPCLSLEPTLIFIPFYLNQACTKNYHLFCHRLRAKQTGQCMALFVML